MSAVVLPQDITYDRAEQLYRQSKKLAHDTHLTMGIAEAGLRAVRARDPRVLRCLERINEVLLGAYEQQLGNTQRTRTDMKLTDRVKPEVMTAYEKCYTLADSIVAEDAPGRGDWEREIAHFAYLYAAVGQFVGAIV